jgi:cell wall-associated NlpC family hydrolase
MQPTGEQFADLLCTQEGDPYIWAAKPDPEEDNPRAADCSGFVHWGANHLHVTPHFPDGSQIQREFCRKHGTTISVEDAAITKGALLLNDHHIAVSLGDGEHTIEAMGKDYGVCRGHIGNRFVEGALVPGMDYGPGWEDI